MTELKRQDGEPERVTPPELLPVLQELAALEPIFHQPRPGTPRAELEQATVEDFWEIGASGRRYRREFVLDVLEKRAAEGRTELWHYTDYHLRELAPGLYLLTYTLVQDAGRLTQRSTIWRKAPTGWQIVFHQGTVVLQS
ncbi:MAG: DUF4440 domain-containing protein [Terracidiphilus sp.]